MWGIFVVPELETAIDDRLGLIGDAVCNIQFLYNLALHSSTVTRDDSASRRRRRSSH